ncbi:MAG: hypothetical protein PWP03_693 [Candidatus Woesearchaeota archaeon]|nr:hypothetical protein [Candidatus Woesearchaeota archaeon]
MKIDVEGFEYQVIKGDLNTFKNLKDVDVVMEIFEDNHNREKTLKLMTEMSYNF